MGVPPVIEYTDDCLTCWDPTLTPKHLYAHFTGIAWNPIWGAPPGPAPNGVFELIKQFGSCLWVLASAWGPIIFKTNLPGTRIEIGIFGSYYFQTILLPNCAFFGVNAFTTPGVWMWRDGECQISEIP